MYIFLSSRKFLQKRYFLKFAFFLAKKYSFFNNNTTIKIGAFSIFKKIFGKKVLFEKCFFFLAKKYSFFFINNITIKSGTFSVIKTLEKSKWYFLVKLVLFVLSCFLKCKMVLNNLVFLSRKYLFRQKVKVCKTYC